MRVQVRIEYWIVQTGYQISGIYTQRLSHWHLIESQALVSIAVTASDQDCTNSKQRMIILLLLASDSANKRVLCT